MRFPRERMVRPPLVDDLAVDGIAFTVIGGTSRAPHGRIEAAVDIHADDPTSGYRFIADELTAKGVTAGEDRVAHLCRVQRLWSVLSKKPGAGRQPEPVVHSDHVKRHVTADTLWLTDIPPREAWEVPPPSTGRTTGSCTWAQPKSGGTSYLRGMLRADGRLLH